MESVQPKRWQRIGIEEELQAALPLLVLPDVGLGAMLHKFVDEDLRERGEERHGEPERRLGSFVEAFVMSAYLESIVAAVCVVELIIECSRHVGGAHADGSRGP